MLIISDLAALFALRKLGCVMGDKERMASSEGSTVEAGTALAPLVAIL